MKRIIENVVIFFSWASTIFLVTGLFSILAYLVIRGGGVVNLQLIFGDVAPMDAILRHKQVFDGLFPAITGTFALVVLAVGIAVPVGLAAGIYMAEYAQGKTKLVLSLLFDVLAGLPSVVVGLAGFSLTVLLHTILPNRVGPCLLLSALALSFWSYRTLFAVRRWPLAQCLHRFGKLRRHWERRRYKISSTYFCRIDWQILQVVLFWL